ncbi:patatin-like phospholipase family protein [Desnuesiella massiliensis]|uniref:patatin-like phospholipase family protein n=1 Tax=Desnuesiella massiliensis TaxID=1650662 RepID=UPI0006E32267|nr:patatin-like phospholipase family protein [Desnuesiella massiliensis]
MKIDAVFEGGGVKGMAFVGSICCLEEKNYSFERFAGTSAGSVIAALLAVGYTGKEIKNIMLNTDFRRFINNKKSIKVYKLYGLLKNKGIHTNDYIEQWLRELLSKKGKLKFKDVSVKGESKLKIIASDITRHEMLILPDDLKNYGLDPMEFDIAKAVRMSTSIPFYFEPYKLYYKDGVSFIVDGGLLSNYPIWIFDIKGIPRWPTLGFNLIGEGQSLTSQGKNDIFSYSLDIVSTMLNRKEDIYIREKDRVRTIYIPTLGVKTTDFDISKETSLKLFNEGYSSTENFLTNWSFSAYVRNHRMI